MTSVQISAAKPVGATYSAAKPVGALTVTVAKPVGVPFAVTAKPVGALVTVMPIPIAVALAPNHQHQTQSQRDMHTCTYKRQQPAVFAPCELDAGLRLRSAARHVIARRMCAQLVAQRADTEMDSFFADATACVQLCSMQPIPQHGPPASSLPVDSKLISQRLAGSATCQTQAVEQLTSRGITQDLFSSSGGLSSRFSSLIVVLGVPGGSGEPLADTAEASAQLSEAVAQRAQEQEHDAVIECCLAQLSSEPQRGQLGCDQPVEPVPISQKPASMQLPSLQCQA